MAIKTSLEGYAELDRKLRELADPKAGANALRASVRNPMMEVAEVARRNIAVLSPGEAKLHRTYRGRLVSAGFAARNIKVVVKMSRSKQSASALLGVVKEAFYAVQFFELGTAKIPRRPWLVPALESSKEEAIRGVGEVLKKRITRIARKRAKAAKAMM